MTVKRLSIFALAAAATAIVLFPAAASAQQGDDASLTLMLSSNDGLRAAGMDYIIQQIDYFRLAGSRSSARLYNADFAWVPGDGRRNADGAAISYLFDHASGSADGVPASAVAGAVDRAAATWAADSCMAGAPLTAVRHPGGDVTVFDYLAGGGTLGDPFAADVVVAGFAEGLDGVFGESTLAFAVTFVFVDGSNMPTDVDGDGRLDTAHSEVFFNPAFEWSLGDDDPGADVQTTALHELGHALGLGHFGAPPESVMSPVYRGTDRQLYPIDHAALCLQYGMSR